MEMVIFLVLVGVFGIVVLVAARKSRSRTNLARRSAAKGINAPDEKLTIRSDTVLGNKNEMWKTRREQATQNFSTKQTFVPKSEAEKQPIYDGYSRRDRHHLATQAKAREGKHSDGLIKARESIQAQELGQDIKPVETKHVAQT